MFLLGHEFAPDLKRRNFAFYDPITTGDSSLSACIQSIMAAEVGERDKALEYARVATVMDLGDVSGNVKDGCHIAAMGGVWMIFVYGFAGLRDYGGQLCFWPALPDVLHCIRFQLQYQGQTLEVNVGQERTEYRLKHGTGLTIRHEKEEVKLSADNPSVQRPNRTPDRELGKSA
ncbi:MAG TPA: glycosyl hydrolase family 65 protein, partial [Nitrospira sp.]